jgi:hypothetical protein
MKQTAVEKMIQYFIYQKNNGVSHWSIQDLIAQLHQVKEIEKEQIKHAYYNGKYNNVSTDTAEQYYTETYEQR